jgi:hypothetical protein
VITGEYEDTALTVKIISTGETLRINDWFSGDQYKVETFRFADGSVLTSAQASERAAVTRGIIGTDGEDDLYAMPDYGTACMVLAGRFPDL